MATEVHVYDDTFGHKYFLPILNVRRKRIILKELQNAASDLLGCVPVPDVNRPIRIHELGTDHPLFDDLV